MEPDTIIRYTSPTQYIIVQGGSCDETAQKELNALLAEKQKYLNEHQQEIQDGSLTIIKSPTPVAGMVVKYDGEGYQKEITPDTENHAVNDSKVSLSAYRGHYAANGNYSWGSHSNRMKITSSTVSGSGRFTNFTDTIGDHNNYLKKVTLQQRAHMIIRQVRLPLHAQQIGRPLKCIKTTMEVSQMRALTFGSMAQNILV